MCQKKAGLFVLQMTQDAVHLDPQSLCPVSCEQFGRAYRRPSWAAGGHLTPADETWRGLGLDTSQLSVWLLLPALHVKPTSWGQIQLLYGTVAQPEWQAKGSEVFSSHLLLAKGRLGSRAVAIKSLISFELDCSRATLHYQDSMTSKSTSHPWQLCLPFVRSW